MHTDQQATPERFVPPNSSSAAPPHLGIAVMLAMTIALAPLALDTYLPAFPVMALSLAVSVHEISLSIAIYVFVLAIGQLVGGPLSDRFGRPVILLSGLGIFTVASLLISQTESLDALLLWRALQAFGGGWAAVCVPALVRDRLSGTEAARFFSLIGLITIIVPALAPGLGSLLLLGFEWPAIFLLLALYAAVLLTLLKLVLFGGQQTLLQHPHLSVWQRYRAVFAVRPALRFMWLQTFSFAIMLLFISHSSFIYQQHFGASPGMFSLFFAANVMLMMVANISNRHLLKRIPAKRILRWAVSVQALGVVLLIAVITMAPNLWLFLPAMMITIGAMGAITPNTQACFMEYFSAHGGTASALMGATQFAVGGTIAAASVLLPESVLAIVIAQAACALVCLWLVWSCARQ